MQSRFKIDKPLVLLYILLIGVGWINIYSASWVENTSDIFDFSQAYGKQLLWIALALLLILFLFFLDIKVFERFGSLFYLILLAGLIGLFLFGNTVSGATSWYHIGGISIQPSEFAKTATALALAKFLTDIQTQIRLVTHQLKALLIIAIPALLILPQPDPGTALVFLAFLIPLYREGLPLGYLMVGIVAAILFISTLIWGYLWVGVSLIGVTIVFLILTRQRRIKRPAVVLALLVCLLFSYGANYIFNNVFEQRHRDRFNIVLGLAEDTQGIGYNTNQSTIAIGSGSWFGKGWTKGTQTKGRFVPEQHTDYIFSTIGEEWGFIGSLFVVLLFVALCVRIVQLAERQKSNFVRIYGYSVAAIICFHFFVNIGMVLGLLPTIGIPLPFISYGGSSLWGFSLLLFIFIRMDASNTYYH